MSIIITNPKLKSLIKKLLTMQDLNLLLKISKIKLKKLDKASDLINKFN